MGLFSFFQNFSNFSNQEKLVFFCISAFFLSIFVMHILPALIKIFFNKFASSEDQEKKNLERKIDLMINEQKSGLGRRSAQEFLNEQTSDPGHLPTSEEAKGLASGGSIKSDKVRSIYENLLTDTDKGKDADLVLELFKGAQWGTGEEFVKIGKEMGKLWPLKSWPIPLSEAFQQIVQEHNENNLYTYKQFKEKMMERCFAKRILEEYQGRKGDLIDLFSKKMSITDDLFLIICCLYLGKKKGIGEEIFFKFVTSINNAEIYENTTRDKKSLHPKELLVLTASAKRKLVKNIEEDYMLIQEIFDEELASYLEIKRLQSQLEETKTIEEASQKLGVKIVWPLSKIKKYYNKWLKENHPDKLSGEELLGEDLEKKHGEITEMVDAYKILESHKRIEEKIKRSFIIP